MARRKADPALEEIEAMVLPALARALDGLLDAASLARPGADAAGYAARLERLAGELERVEAELQALEAKLRGHGVRAA